MEQEAECSGQLAGCVMHSLRASDRFDADMMTG
jgi:hypothetical protein